MSGGVFSGLSLAGATKPEMSLDQRLFDAPKDGDTILPIVKSMPSESQAPTASQVPESSQSPPPTTSPKPPPLATDTTDSTNHGPTHLAVTASRTPALAKPSNTERLAKKNGPPAIPLDTARAERPLTEPATKSVARFDITEKPWRKDSFLFTDSEFDRLEDLKLELRRRFDLKATKNDIARVAFHGLFEEYSREPNKSSIVRYLRSKKS